MIIHRFPVSNYRPQVQNDPLTVPIGPLTPSGFRLLHVFQFPRFGDVDDDGAMELLYAKGCGEQVTYSIPDGQQRWRFAEPEGIVAADMRVDSAVPVIDLDGDGRTEIACFRQFGSQTHLCVLEGNTGRVRHSVPVEKSPKDLHASLIPARLDGPGRPLSLVLHRDYWRIEVYTHDLRPRWTATIPELGHTTNVADVDGDGRDELWTGTRLYAADGRDIWSKPELLDGTGEGHPDSNRIADVDGDGRVELVLATGAQLLNTDGAVIWRRDDIVHHAQSVRLVRGRDQTLLCYTDLPRYETDIWLTWRGREVRDVGCWCVVLDARGNEVSRFEGVHTPQTGDWDGDGEDEIVVLAPDRVHLDIRKATGTLVERLPIGERVYVSDLVVLPVLRGARGAQVIVHEWNDDETRTDCVIFENDKAGNGCPPATPEQCAAYTCY